MPYISCDEALCDEKAWTGHDCFSDHWEPDPLFTVWFWDATAYATPEEKKNPGKWGPLYANVSKAEAEEWVDLEGASGFIMRPVSDPPTPHY